MYAYIKGIATMAYDGKIVLECSGVGYEINVSSYSLDGISIGDEMVTLYTYLVVREDEMSLYGFKTLEEKEMFLKLISVSGIGPKMAIGILSEISIANLMGAIAGEDLRSLTCIKGLGKKTAERLILELKDKVNPMEALAMGGVLENKSQIDENIFDDAVSALVGLGISKNEATRLVKQVAKKDMSLEEIITNVLRSISR